MAIIILRIDAAASAAYLAGATAKVALAESIDAVGTGLTQFDQPVLFLLLMRARLTEVAQVPQFKLSFWVFTQDSGLQHCRRPGGQLTQRPFSQWPLIH